MSKVKVLVVDDSAVMRQFLVEGLSRHKDIEIVGTAPDAYVARNKILMLKPDVVTLDIQMPKIDGITFLQKIIKHYPVPVVIVSSLNKEVLDGAMSAIKAGTVDYVEKPASNGDRNKTMKLLAKKIKDLNKAKVKFRTEYKASASSVRQVSNDLMRNTVIAIGASTGGTVAIKQILTRLPTGFAPVIITQHMPAEFTKSFANRLDTLCRLSVKEAQDGDLVEQGKALIAPGGHHMILRQGANGYFVKLDKSPLVHNQRPSVDVMFNSVADVAGRDSIGVILTGMGADGADGLLRMKESGAYTISQDKASCVVFGMPKRAIEVGAACEVLDIKNIPNVLVKKFNASSDQ